MHTISNSNSNPWKKNRTRSWLTGPGARVCSSVRQRLHTNPADYLHVHVHELRVSISNFGIQKKKTIWRCSTSSVPWAYTAGNRQRQIVFLSSCNLFNTQHQHGPLVHDLLTTKCERIYVVVSSHRTAYARYMRTVARNVSI